MTSLMTHLHQANISPHLFVPVFIITSSHSLSFHIKIIYLEIMSLGGLFYRSQITEKNEA